MTKTPKGLERPISGTRSSDSRTHTIPASVLYQNNRVLHETVLASYLRHTLTSKEMIRVFEEGAAQHAEVGDASAVEADYSGELGARRT